MQLLAFGGLRIGEAGGLRASDWTPERRLLQVRRQQTRNGTSDLKTDAGRRKIFLTKELTQVLNEHLAKYPPVVDRIFSTRAGGPVYADIFYPVFKTACRKAEVRAFHPHELRHHAVSAMLSAGIPPRTVQAVVGHESPTMTLGVYGHVSEADLEAAATQLEQ
jgi:integrase